MIRETDFTEAELRCLARSLKDLYERNGFGVVDMDVSNVTKYGAEDYRVFYNYETPTGEVRRMDGFFSFRLWTHDTSGPVCEDLMFSDNI